MDISSKYNLLRVFVESMDTKDNLFKEAVLEGIDELLKKSILSGEYNAENTNDKLKSLRHSWDQEDGGKWRENFVETMKETWRALRETHKSEDDIGKHIARLILNNVDDETEARVIFNDILSGIWWDDATVRRWQRHYDSRKHIFLNKNEDKGNRKADIEMLAKLNGVHFVVVDAATDDIPDSSYFQDGDILFFKNMEQASSEMLDAINSFIENPQTANKKLWVVAEGRGVSGNFRTNKRDIEETIAEWHKTGHANSQYERKIAALKALKEKPIKTTYAGSIDSDDEIKDFLR